LSESESDVAAVAVLPGPQRDADLREPPAAAPHDPVGAVKGVVAELTVVDSVPQHVEGADQDGVPDSNYVFSYRRVAGRDDRTVDQVETAKAGAEATAFRQASPLDHRSHMP
jgi:hypothetical protein